MLAAIWCIFGFAGLIVGAEILIRSGTRLAALIGIPPILIGLTVVSIGTSMPELAVGIDAALVGSGALAVGNIAGTNIFNILFILGLSALLLPLSLELRTIRIDLPVMIAAAVALVVMAWDGLLTRTDGAILFAAALVYTAVIMHGARRANRGDMAEYAKEYGIAPALTHIDIPIMALVTLVCVPIFLRGHRVTRLEGGLFVAAYLAYLTYLLVART